MAKEYLVSKYQITLIEKHIANGDFDAASKIMNQILNPSPKVRVGEVELQKLRESILLQSDKSIGDTLLIIKSEMDIKELKSFLYDKIENADDQELREMFKQQYDELKIQEKEFNQLASRYTPQKDEFETLFTAQNESQVKKTYRGR